MTTDGNTFVQDNVPQCLWWLKDASMIKQAFEALCVNELKGLEFECDNKSRAPCIRTGEQMLERVAFGESTVEGATIGLSKILGSCWALTYLALVLGKPRFQTMLDPSLLAGKSSSAGGAAVSVSGGGGKNSGLLDGGLLLASGDVVNTGEVVENHDGSPDGGRSSTVKGSKARGVVGMLRRRAERRRRRRHRRRRRMAVTSAAAVSAEHDAASVLKTSGVTGRVAAPMPLRAGK
ncbi:ABC transporter [Ectocarpus siliculosus]|uniref:ABC transporter n=1 Tax=Ectocarpus siliculosus TaxID=2880 RepID=D8LKI6_ECTSI|nr:ABC transporter [Ectocarpus siliculosus]|eukprot:CBN74576.1 ABC transporter [Ectocarpus siliculosus]